eukprot:scaffold172_cov341-Pavlova_lutheri.AAC.3
MDGLRTVFVFEHGHGQLLQTRDWFLSRWIDGESMQALQGSVHPLAPDVCAHRPCLLPQPTPWDALEPLASALESGQMEGLDIHTCGMRVGLHLVE